jgi:hypothetical protein
MDGPKFKFVLGSMIELFGRAMEDAGVNDQSAQTIMTLFGYLAKASDEVLRREMNLIA